MPTTTKTTQPHDFGRLSDRQFEDLVRQLIGTMENDWVQRPEPIGRLGSDAGQDIRVDEWVWWRGRRTKRKRKWVFQAKRYKSIGPKQLVKIVEDAVPAGAKPPYALVAAVACPVSKKGFDDFTDAAKKRGIEHAEVWAEATLGDLLTLSRNARIASFYFGDGRAIEGTVPLSLFLDRSPGRDLVLLRRDAEVAALSSASDDVILVGPPGTGKSRLALEAEDVRFVSLRSDADAVAESLRIHQPRHLVLDDAGLALDRLEMLLELRREGHDFKIIATTWGEKLDAVQALLPTATVISVGRIPRADMDALLRALGITNYWLLMGILGQADGRPGWAVALADLAHHGGGLDVVAGRGLLRQLQPGLRKIGKSSTSAMAFLSLIALVGPVDLAKEMDPIDAFLHISQLERARLLEEGAAAGVIEQRGGSIVIAPEALRAALVAHWYFEKPTPASLEPVLRTWPALRWRIVGLLIAASRRSSAVRAKLDSFIPDLKLLYEPQLEEYTALDVDAAHRALAATAGLPLHDGKRAAVRRVAAKRFVLEGAVSDLLDASLGDTRAEHSQPDHPIRVLGELGRRVSPHQETSFDARMPILDAAEEWLQRSADLEHQLSWSRLMVHLLSPHVEGGHPDTATLRKYNMQAGIETPSRLQQIADEIWPAVEKRLPTLEAEAQVSLVQALDEWIRVQRQFPGAFGHVPDDAAARIAASFVQRQLAALRAAAEHRPALQLALHNSLRFLGAPGRPRLDPEFRILTTLLDDRHHRDSEHVGHVLERQVGAWCVENPDELMRRLKRWADEAAKTGRSLRPGILLAFDRLHPKLPDLEAYLQAGLDAGLTWELGPLMKAAIDRATVAPAWLAPALTGAARPTALEAALLPGPNRRATKAALKALTDADRYVVEQTTITHGHRGHTWASRALLRHPDPDVRGAATIWFNIGQKSPGTPLPKGWYSDWARAFETAPLEARHGGDNYQLGQQLEYLVTSDPDLVERWFVRQLTLHAEEMVRLSTRSEFVLTGLPREHRDRILRSAPDRVWQLLPMLLGDDVEWAGQLLDDGVIDAGDLWATLHNANHDGMSVERAMKWGSLMLPRGASPETIAALVEESGYVGSIANVFAKARSLFEAFQPQNADERRVRRAALRRFGALEASAREDDVKNEITGEI